MQNGVPGHRGWGLAESTRELLETADAAEVARRDRQVDRAITAFLARPAGSVQLDEALADQRTILAHHFGVPEDYFTDPGVGRPVVERRRHPVAAVPGTSPSTPAADPVVPRPRRRVGVAALAVGVLAGAAVGGAAGYQVGVGAARPGATVAAPANAAAIDHSAPDAAGQPAPGHSAPGHSAPAAQSLRAAAPVAPAAGQAPAGVVQVLVRSGAAAATGSGVVLRDGLLLTDDHLFTHPGPVAVQLRDGATRPAHLVGRDPATGIAVLAADPAGLVPAELGNSDAVRVGQHVQAVGWAHDHALTDRTVRAVDRPAAPAHPAPRPAAVPAMIETDAAGNGPLVDARGAVIGVGTATPAPPGAGYAIPINQAVRAADRLIAANKAPHAVPPHPATAHIHGVAPGAAPAGHVVP